MGRVHKNITARAMARVPKSRRAIATISRSRRARTKARVRGRTREKNLSEEVVRNHAKTSIPMDPHHWNLHEETGLRSHHAETHRRRKALLREE